MKLFEFYDAPAEGYQDQEADNSVPELGELRKTKLTLKQISKLRKMYVCVITKKLKNLRRYKHNLLLLLRNCRLILIIVSFYTHFTPINY